MRKHKKGAMNLSIEIIIVIVLAKTLLGLGLNFIRTQIKSISETATTVQEQTRQSILDDLRVGNKKLSFPTGRVTLSPNERKDLAVGVQNLEDVPITFTLKVFWRDPAATAPGTEFKELTPKSKLDSADATIGIFLWDNTAQELGQGEARVIPLNFQAPSIKDTYLYKIEIWRTDAGPSAPATYDAKTFFVTVG